MRLSTEERLKRLEEVVALLATEIEVRQEPSMWLTQPRPSIEELVEKTLYPEHFKL